MMDAEKALSGMEKCCGICVLPWKKYVDLYFHYIIPTRSSTVHTNFSIWVRLLVRTFNLLKFRAGYIKCIQNISIISYFIFITLKKIYFPLEIITIKKTREHGKVRAMVKLWTISHNVWWWMASIWLHLDTLESKRNNKKCMLLENKINFHSG